MTISTVSFDKAKIYKNKMIFTEYGKDSVSVRIFDNMGKNLVNKISYKPVKKIEGDYFVITKKNQYEIPNQKTIFKTIERIYDRFGNLLFVKNKTL